MQADNPYTNMQRTSYDTHYKKMVANHRQHDKNPEYWDILLYDIKADPAKWQGKNALDFGCGQGRNVSNLLNLAPFAAVDGADISSKNLEVAAKNILTDAGTIAKTTLYCTSGIALDSVPSDNYDFVMSTIVMQHIAVYDIRFAILSDKYRVLRSGGTLSFQMGFDNDSRNAKRWASYFENRYTARGTNGMCDVVVENPSHIIDDMRKIGYQDISYKIGTAFDCLHHNWIYVKATK